MGKYKKIQRELGYTVSKRKNKFPSKSKLFQMSNNGAIQIFISSPSNQASESPPSRDEEEIKT